MSHKPIPQATIDELNRAMRVMRHIKHPARIVASDLTPSERHLLQTISYLAEASDIVRPSDVAERSRIRPSAVSPTLSSLEAKGLIERRGDTADRRVVSIVLTDEGVATSQRIKVAVEAQLEGLAVELGEDDARTFARLVTAVADYFAAQNREHGALPDA